MQEKTRKILVKTAEKCTKEGKNLTAPRQQVLACLIEAKEPLKAYDVVEAIGNVKPMTVYRALDFLTKEGFAHRIESLNAYTACAEAHCRHTDSQYLVCNSCGEVEEIHDHAIDNYIEKKIADTGFSPSHKALEIHGTCESCKK